MKKLDLRAIRFGRLLVIERSASHFDGKRKRVLYRCRCDCGVEGTFRSDDLRSGDTKSCGCLRRDLLETNLTGQRFGKLLVKERSEKKGKSTHTFWKCRCDCGKDYIVSAQHLTVGNTKSCGCLYDRTEEEELVLSKDRFFTNVKVVGNCWEWQGCKVLGYGVMYHNKKTIRAHRFSYLIHKGTLDSELFICHTCDNKRCVNPDHLYQGTRFDNAQDALQRGLLKCGEKSHIAKLRKEQVLEILKSKVTLTELARRYGVGKSTIQRIKKRESWKQVYIP